MQYEAQLIASSPNEFVFSNESRSTVLEFTKDADMTAILQQLKKEDIYTSHHLSLHLDNIRGHDIYPIIDIYINLDNDHEPDKTHYAGSLALYGLPQSSAINGPAIRAGRHHVIEMDEVLLRLGRKPNWSNRRLTLSFIPNGPLRALASLTFGAIGLYYHAG